MVYVNYLLHWGSNYSAKLRRTLHGGHTIFPYFPDLSFTNALSPEARATFERWAERSARLQDLTEAALRAVLNQDAHAYQAAVEALQPGAGQAGKLVLAIYLSKAAFQVYILKHPEASDRFPDDACRRAMGAHSITINWGPKFADRFTKEESDPLWQRFATLNATLQAETEHFVPGFQSGPMRYFFEQMPADFGVEAFIASWAA